MVYFSHFHKSISIIFIYLYFEAHHYKYGNIFDNNFSCNSNMYLYGIPMRTRTHNKCHHREYSFNVLEWIFLLTSIAKIQNRFLDVVLSRNLHQLFFYIRLYFVDHSTHECICIRIRRNRFSALWCPYLLKYDYTSHSYRKLSK